MSEKEADELMKSGKKHLEKTMLKWKPNHDAAADDYEKAAKIYLQLKLKDKCIDAFTKASYEHSKAKNTYFSGKCLEALALYLSETENEQYAKIVAASNGAPSTDAVRQHFESIQAAAKYYERAAQIYSEDSKLGNQSDAMGKASQLYTELIKQESRKLPQQRNEAVLQQAQNEYRRFTNESLKSLELNWEVNEASPHKMPEMYKNVILSAIRNNDFFTAIQAEKRILGIVEKGGESGAGAAFSVDNEVYDDTKNLYKRLKQPHNTAKVGLEVVILILAFNSDYIWAKKEMAKLSRIDSFRGSSEENCANQILQCYEDRDDEMLADTIKSQGNVLNFLLSDISRLAKKLKVTPTTSAGAPATGVVTAKSPSGAGASTQPQQQEQGRAGATAEEEYLDPEDDLR